MRTQRTHVTNPAMVAAVFPAPNTSPAFRGEMSETKQKKHEIEHGQGYRICDTKHLPSEKQTRLHARRRVHTLKLLAGNLNRCLERKSRSHFAIFAKLYA